jgi:hypothetical protein
MAVIVVLVTAFVLLLIACAFCINRRTPPAQPNSNARRRLAEVKARLDMLHAERDRLGDPAYEKAAEDEIIWNELIELELQDIDEQLTRIRNSAGGQ